MATRSMRPWLRRSSRWSTRSGSSRSAPAASSPCSRAATGRRTPWTGGWTCPAAVARPPTPPVRTWDVSTAYGGGVDMTIGPGSVAVHGSLAAFGEAHRRDGRLPWREIVAPAVEVARGGYRLTSAARYYLDYTHDDIFGWDAESRAVLHDAEGELTTGRIVMPDLVASLELIAADGPGVLHHGELAELISRDVTGRGGLLTQADLAAYEPVVRPALVSRAGGWTLSTTPPPPSVGGVCLAAMLRLLLAHPDGEPARRRPRRPGPAGGARTPARRAGPRPRPGGGGRARSSTASTTTTSPSSSRARPPTCRRPTAPVRRAPSRSRRATAPG